RFGIRDILVPRLVRKLHDVLRKQQVQGPVQSHAEFLFESRQFAQVDGSPYPPRKKAREFNTENIGDAGSLSDRRKLAEGRKHEGPLWPFSDRSADIPGKDFSLAERMLSGWRVGFACGTVRDCRAIAQRPHAPPPDDLHVLVHYNSAVLFLARQLLQKWVGRGAR